VLLELASSTILTSPVACPHGVQVEIDHYDPMKARPGRHVGDVDVIRHVAGRQLNPANHQASRPSPAVDVSGSRLELYLTDPAREPDTARWTTQLLFRLAD
jgi:hypothetical protein